MGAPEPEAVQHLDKRAGLVEVVDELDELDPVDGRHGHRRTAPDLLVEPQERAHAVIGDPAGRRRAEVVAEDLVADRPLVADLLELADHRRHRQIALTGKAPVVAAEKEQVHGDARRIGGLHQDDPLRRDLRDVVDGKPPGQQVKAVEDHADMRMIGAAHRFPPLPVVVDVTAPGQGLVADPDAECLGQLTQVVQIGGDPRHVAGRLGRDAAADEEQRRSEPAHELELAPGTLEGLAAGRLRQPFEVAKRLQRDDLEAERAGQRTNVLGPAVEIGEVVLEDLHGLKTGLGRGAKLLAQRSRHGNRCDGPFHGCLS